MFSRKGGSIPPNFLKHQLVENLVLSYHLAYPSLKTDKGRFDSNIFSQAIFFGLRHYNVFGGPPVLFK